MLVSILVFLLPSTSLNYPLLLALRSFKVYRMSIISIILIKFNTIRINKTINLFTPN